MSGQVLPAEVLRFERYRYAQAALSTPRPDVESIKGSTYF